jgi:poly(hydroxyalkanoate) granule-associated protein
MATKMKDMMGAEPAAIVDAVAASAQQIWQAGLGAFAKAQQDGGALFDSLVRDGAQLHKLTQDLARDKVPGMTGKVGRLASGSWDKIEKIFEDRVARSLHSLGVPSREEVDALRREIDALKAAMPGPAAATATATAPAATARKSAPKAAKAAKDAREVKDVAKRVPGKAAAVTKRPARAEGTRVRA